MHNSTCKCSSVPNTRFLTFNNGGPRSNQMFIGTRQYWNWNAWPQKLVGALGAYPLVQVCAAPPVLVGQDVAPWETGPMERRQSCTSSQFVGLFIKRDKLYFERIFQHCWQVSFIIFDLYGCVNISYHIAGTFKRIWNSLLILDAYAMSPEKTL
jgi:hypothetical protein